MGAGRSHAAIIDQLGGYRAVARALRLPENNIAQWKTRDRIPPLYWVGIEKFARRQGVKLTVHDILRADHARGSRTRAA